MSWAGWLEMSFTPSAILFHVKRLRYSLILPEVQHKPPIKLHYSCDAIVVDSQQLFQNTQKVLRRCYA